MTCIFFDITIDFCLVYYALYEGKHDEGPRTTVWIIDDTETCRLIFHEDHMQGFDDTNDKS